MTPNLANLVAQALDEGSHYIAFRDTGETDLLREVARLAARRQGRDRVLIIAPRLEEMTEIAGYVRSFDPTAFVGRISGSGRTVEVGTIRHAQRRIRSGPVPYTLLVLLPGLPQAEKIALIDAMPQAAVLDADPHAGAPLRPADRVLYRPAGHPLQTLNTTTPLTSHYRH